jgi:hypothetical protein
MNCHEKAHKPQKSILSFNLRWTRIPHVGQIHSNMDLGVEKLSKKRGNLKKSNQIKVNQTKNCSFGTGARPAGSRASPTKSDLVKPKTVFGGRKERGEAGAPVEKLRSIKPN